MSRLSRSPACQQRQSMHGRGTRRPRGSVTLSGRLAYLDNLKVLMVVGVIVAHATFAWTTSATGS